MSIWAGAESSGSDVIVAHRQSERDREREWQATKIDLNPDRLALVSQC